MQPESMDTVFRALASASRRRMLDLIKDAPGCSVNDLAGFFDESRINVMKHLAVLEEAGLVISEKEGRMRRLWFNAVPIQMITDRWMSEYSHLWASPLTKLKYHIESTQQGGEDERREQGDLQGIHPRPN
jgi:DNA-binding transcriptional ArsR family regulator